MSLFKRIQEKRQTRFEAVRAAREILDGADTDNRDLTDDEKGKWTELHATIEALGEEVRRFEAQHTADMLAAAKETLPVEKRDAGKATLDVRNRVLRAFMRGDSRFLKDGDLEIAQVMGVDIRRDEFSIERRMALSHITATEGAELIPEGFVPRIETAMKAWGGMRRVGCEVFKTASGNPLPIPTGDDTANIGAILAENTETTGADGSGPDPVFGNVTLGAYKYETKMVAVPYELIEDEAVNLESWLAEQLGIRLGRITNSHFTIGTGTAQPRGVVPASAVGATNATLDFDALLELIHSVDPAYRMAGAHFMLNDASLLTLKQEKDTGGRYIWQPAGVAGAGSEIAQPTLLGYPYVINQDMPDHAAAAKSVTFGAHWYYKIRDAGAMRFKVLRERFAEKDQIAFLGFSRHDGNMTIPAAVKHLLGA